MEQDLNFIQQIDILANHFKNGIRSFARDFVKIPIADGRDKDEAASNYMSALVVSGTYKEWQDKLDGLVMDCVGQFNIDSETVISLMDFDLDGVIRSGFLAAWDDELDGQGSS